MAPGFRPGRKSRIWVNALRLSRVTDTYDLKRMCNAIDVSTHENDDMAYIAGERDADVAFGGIFDGTTAGAQQFIIATMGSSALQAWSFTPEGDAVGSLCYEWNSVETQLTVSAPAKGRVGITGGTKPTRRIYPGKVHLQGTLAIATTAAQTVIDGGAASLLGSMGNFHLTDESTLGSITVKLQHSSVATSAFVDLYTFTSTSTGFQSSTSSATVKRYTRALVSAFTGGAGKSVNCLASLGRAV